MVRSMLLLCLSITTASVARTEELEIFPEGVPGLRPGVTSAETDTGGPGNTPLLRNIVEPTLTVFVPERRTSDAAVIICPGGGYHVLAFGYEGVDVGRWFAERGVTAFVLKSRLPQEELFENPTVRPLQDAQRAIGFVKRVADDYGLDPDRIGIMGFSAGGHLAAAASTRFHRPIEGAGVGTISLRPAFSILIYPVISFDSSFGHSGSRRNLIGNDPSAAVVRKHSNELQVTVETPPAFLVHTFDDFVDAENSLRYASALKRMQVPVELHLYDRGGHGFGLSKHRGIPVESWPDRLEEWMAVNGWMRE